MLASLRGDHGLKRYSATTHFSLMSSFSVVEVDPFIQIGLQGLNGFVKLFAECNLVKFLQDRLVETLADAVGLR